MVSKASSFDYNNMSNLVQTIVGRGAYRLQKTISKRVHDHSFPSIILDLHQMCLNLAIYSPCHPMLMFAFTCFLFRIVDHVRPPPSFDFCSIPLHLWLAIKPLGVHLLQCAHGGERTTAHDVVWNLFYIHCKRCKVSYLVNPHSSLWYSC